MVAVAVAVSVVVVGVVGVVTVLRGRWTLVGVMVVVLVISGMVLRLVVGGGGGAPETLAWLEFPGLWGRLCLGWGRRSRGGGIRVRWGVGYGYVDVIGKSALVVDCGREIVRYPPLIIYEEANVVGTRRQRDYSVIDGRCG